MIWLASILIPGAGFYWAGFPRGAAFVGVTVALFWLLAWPFAIPLHLFAVAAGTDQLKRSRFPQQPV